ncbi:hypothetical protein pb186bvf_012707 [Paramecium bursaria]
MSHYFENDGYEYQPSEPSEKPEPTPNKPQRISGQTHESLVYSASSQETNRISLSMGSPNFSKGPLILINNEQDQQYMNKLRNQYQPSQNMPKVVQVIKNESIKKETHKERSPLQTPQKVENLDLEQQLIQEKLNSEQLRVYNHIIKLELEKKLHNQGVFIINGKSKKKNENAIDLYLEIQHNRVQMQTLQNEFKQKDQIIQHLENQLKQSNQINDLMKKHEQELQIQNDELVQSLEDAMKNINSANANINHLEAEKDSLIDHIEELTRNSKQQQSKFDQMEQNYKDLQQQLLNAQEQIKRVQQNSQKHIQLEQEINQKQNELQDAENVRKQLSKAIGDKQKEIMQYQLQLTENTNKLLEYEQVNREQSRQLNESMSQILILKKQAEEQKSQINILNENLEHINYEYESNASRTGRQVLETDRILIEKEQLIKKQQKELESTVVQNQQMQKEFQQLLKVHEQLGIYQEKQLSQQRYIEELVNTVQQLQSQLRELEDTLSQTNQQVYDTKGQYNNLQMERQQILEELEQVQSKLFDANNQVNRLTQENQEMNDIIQDRQDIEAKFKSLEIKFSAEQQYYENTIRELQAKLENSAGNSIINFADDKRIQELQKLYEKIDRILFNLSNQVSNEKPSHNMDQIISQIHQSLVNLEQQLFKPKIDMQSRKTSSNLQILEKSTSRFQEQDGDSYNIRQIQTYQATPKESIITSSKEEIYKFSSLNINLMLLDLYSSFQFKQLYGFVQQKYQNINSERKKMINKYKSSYSESNGTASTEQKSLNIANLSFNNKFQEYLDGKIKGVDVIKHNNLIKPKTISIKKYNDSPKHEKPRQSQQQIDFKQIKEFISDRDVYDELHVKNFQRQNSMNMKGSIIRNSILGPRQNIRKLTNIHRNSAILSQYQEQKRLNHFENITNSFKQQIQKKNLLSPPDGLIDYSDQMFVQNRQLTIIKKQKPIKNVGQKLKHIRLENASPQAIVQVYQKEFRAKSDHFMRSNDIQQSQIIAHLGNLDNYELEFQQQHHVSSPRAQKRIQYIPLKRNLQIKDQGDEYEEDSSIVSETEKLKLTEESINQRRESHQNNRIYTKDRKYK